MIIITKFNIEDAFKEEKDFSKLVDKLITHYKLELEKIQAAFLIHLPNEVSKLGNLLTYTNDCFKEDFHYITQNYVIKKDEIEKFNKLYEEKRKYFKSLTDTVFDNFYPL